MVKSDGVAEFVLCRVDNPLVRVTIERVEQVVLVEVYIRVDHSPGNRVGRCFGQARCTSVVVVHLFDDNVCLLLVRSGSEAEGSRLVPTLNGRVCRVI